MYRKTLFEEESETTTPDGVSTEIQPTGGTHGVKLLLEHPMDDFNALQKYQQSIGSHLDDLIFRLEKRAEIRRQITTRKSVQENKPDRISDLLEEAAQELRKCKDVPQ